MNISEEFDRIAEDFYKDFGYYPIGKSNPVGVYPPSEKTRADTFGIWIRGYNRGIDKLNGGG